jgi:hypothetical protein
MIIEKNHTEYTIKSLTVVTDEAKYNNQIDKNTIRQQLQEVECNFSLKLDSDGNPIGLFVDLEELTKLVPALTKTLGWPE